MIEIWKDIVGYERCYEVSNLGRIKNVERQCKTKNNSIRTIRERILKSYIHKNGYSYTRLSKNGKVKGFRTHRLVAQAFIPNPEEKFGTNHKDGDKTNNEVINLEWATNSENQKHAYRIGLKSKKGEKHHFFRKKLSKEHRRKISEAHKKRFII
jgi:hypothetical protein